MMMTTATTTTGERPSPLKDPEVRKGLMSPDTIQGMQFTCGEENQYGEGLVRVTVRPFCYFEDRPIWEAVYESDITGVRPAVLVHCDPEDYDGMKYNVLIVEHVNIAPREIALFDDLTEAMSAAMLADVVNEYEGCVECERERLRDEEKYNEITRQLWEEAYLDAIT